MGSGCGHVPTDSTDHQTVNHSQSKMGIHPSPLKKQALMYNIPGFPSGYICIYVEVPVPSTAVVL